MCNGWSNRSTWLVNLILDNDQDLYLCRLDELEELTAPVTMRDARRIANGLGISQRLLKEGQAKAGDVNWFEIADAWEDERKEMDNV